MVAQIANEIHDDADLLFSELSGWQKRRGTRTLYTHCYIAGMASQWFRMEEHKAFADENGIQISDLVEAGESFVQASFREYKKKDGNFLDWVQGIVLQAWIDLVIATLIHAGKLEYAEIIQRYVDNISNFGRTGNNHKELSAILSIYIDVSNTGDTMPSSMLERDHHTPDEANQNFENTKDNFAYERGIFSELIAELQSNKRVQQPTKLEQILNVFEANLGKPVSTELLMPIFAETIDADRQMRVALSKLNQRLQPAGIHLEHAPTYQTMRIK
jgi:hypothetical protein